MNPLVSVIIPTYKRPNNLIRAINSVLQQTYNNIEVIVVDDNNETSPERKETEILMERYLSNPNFFYYKHKYNKNGSAARNTGIKNSNGKYIAFLDDDDEFLPNKIKLQVSELVNRGSDYNICYTGYIRKLNDKEIGKSYDNAEGNITKKILMSHLYLSAGSNILIKKEVAEKISGFNEEYTRRQDLEFLIRASLHTKVAYVPSYELIIHKDDKSNASKLTLEKFKSNTDFFLNDFECIINKYFSKDKEKIVHSQYLLVIRSYLLNKDFRIAFELIQEYNIKNIDVLRFLIYSINRKITKRIYGFKI